MFKLCIFFQWAGHLRSQLVGSWLNIPSSPLPRFLPGASHWPQSTQGWRPCLDGAAFHVDKSVSYLQGPASGAEPLEGSCGQQLAGWLLLLLLPDLIQPPRLSHFQSDSDRLTLILGLCIYCFQEKAMAPHSSTLAWKVPWTEEPGRLSPWGR